MQRGTTSPPMGVRRRGGFTFVEILAAMLMLAVLLPAIVGGLGVASRAAACAERDGVALQLAQNQLNLLVTDTNVTAVAAGGDCGEDWPGYRWSAQRTAWPEDDMWLLTVEVAYAVRGLARAVSLSTLTKGTTP